MRFEEKRIDQKGGTPSYCDICLDDHYNRYLSCCLEYQKLKLVLFHLLYLKTPIILAMNLPLRSLKQKTISTIEKFWIESLDKAENLPWNIKDVSLPLARIKRLMKVEEEVKMVASEVPILFSKIAEVFIEELTLRAWLNTEENKRRILQKNDLSAAVKTSDVFDFLIFIIPRNELETTFTEYDQEEYNHGKRFLAPPSPVNKPLNKYEYVDGPYDDPHHSR
ncbi:CCAAT-box binding factor [Spraguea lophii 42_110]|uniref:CCAAT-box binding factor n=1 Tax=Spraguea lophii (strain 42_110) TaxID=1358809 RepID=S7XRA0_SPRLO|nr:CCAAT-box binding factor [Spraguea lophii 42_110]